MPKKPNPSVFLKLSQKVLKALIERNLSYWEGLLDDTRKGILDVITKGLIEGKAPRTIGEEIIKFGFSAPRAESIARTEVMYALNEAAKENYRESGFEYIIWIAEQDNRTCLDIETKLPDGTYAFGCWDLDQTVWEMENMPPIPRHVRCRCAISVADEEEYIEMWGKK